MRRQKLTPIDCIPIEIRGTSLYKRMPTCVRCSLSETRTHVVYGRGDPRCSLWFVGEAPGADEDAQALAFVGRAGRLLDLCLTKAKIWDFFITNIVKCRPPDNRDPVEVEVARCQHWLSRQLELYPPRVIVAMGRYSIGNFLGFTRAETIKMTVGKQVGKVQPYHLNDAIAIMPTYHPAYLGRNGEALPAFIRQLDRAQRLCQKLLAQNG